MKVQRGDKNWLKRSMDESKGKGGTLELEKELPSYACTDWYKFSRSSFGLWCGQINVTSDAIDYLGTKYCSNLFKELASSLRQQYKVLHCSAFSRPPPDSWNVKAIIDRDFLKRRKRKRWRARNYIDSQRACRLMATDETEGYRS